MGPGSAGTVFGLCFRSFYCLLEHIGHPRYEGVVVFRVLASKESGWTLSVAASRQSMRLLVLLDTHFLHLFCSYSHLESPGLEPKFQVYNCQILIRHWRSGLKPRWY